MSERVSQSVSQAGRQAGREAGGKAGGQKDGQTDRKQLTFDLHFSHASHVPLGVGGVAGVATR